MDKIDNEIVKFVLNNKDKKRKVFKRLPVKRDDICNPSFINRGEYIKTAANEVPDNQGGWTYNNGYTHDYMYCIIEDKILVIEEKRDVEYGDTIGIYLSLYPEADTYTIKTTKGHSEKPYVTFVNEDEKTISAYSFELPRKDLSQFNGIRLVDYISPISIEELQERIKPKTLHR